MPALPADDAAPPDGDPEDVIDAGPVGSWLVQIRAAVDSEQASDVPCGSCTACCRSSQFVHIAPDETSTLAHIPDGLTFPAPGLPRGHVLLGYDEHGRCPMLTDDGCSIYDHRPRTCRIYDCRVFTATGIDPGETKVEIESRTRRWRFIEADDADRTHLAAVRAAAALVQARPSPLDDLGVALPRDPTQQAVLAIEIAPAFLAARDGRVEVVEPDLSTVAAAVQRARDRRRS